MTKEHHYKKSGKLVVPQRSKNNLEKYGVENVFQLESVKEKCNTADTIEKANKARAEKRDKLKASGEYDQFVRGVAEKSRKTRLAGHSSSEEYFAHVTEQCKKICLEKYGVTNYAKSAEAHTYHRKDLKYDNQYFDST